MLVMGTSYAQSVGNMPDANKAIVIVNGKYGAIDKSGRYIVQPQYDKLFPFYNGKNFSVIEIIIKFTFIPENNLAVLKSNFKHLVSPFS